MKTNGRFLVALIAIWLGSTAASPLRAATPKEGRYRGTFTIRYVVDGTKTEIKKVVPIAGNYAGTNLQLVLAEALDLALFEGTTFNAAVQDGSITLRPNNDAVPYSLSNVKTTAGAIKGDTDLGVVPVPAGTGFARRLISLALTRVGPIVVLP